MSPSSIPLVCLFIAALLPYVWFGPFVKAITAQLGGYNNDAPRADQGKANDVAARILGAHQNAFEALVVFAPAVLASLLVKSHPEAVAGICVVWVIARIIHGVAYVSGKSKLRTAAFAVGMLASMVLLGMAAAKGNCCEAKTESCCAKH